MSNLSELIKLATEVANNDLTVGLCGFSDSYQTEEEFLAKAKDALFRYETEPENRNLIMLEVFSLVMADTKRAAGLLHPSELSRYDILCLREIYFTLTNAPTSAKTRAIDTGLQRIFDLGKLIHMYIQSNLHRAGALVSVEEKFKDLDALTTGATDGVLKEGYRILEIKSMNTAQFYRLTAPVDKHVKQATLYAKGIGKKYGVDIKEIYFIYYDKNTSQLKSFVEPVDNVFYASLTDAVAHVKKLVLKNQRRRLPLEQHEFPQRLACLKSSSERATNCAFAKFCFSHK